MRIAVASGKGGTGKTTVAVGLALSLAGSRKEWERPLLLDCDVEAPDAHLFLRPEFEETVPAPVQVPRIDMERCIVCGDCAAVCRFNALAVLGGQVVVLPELCHSCGSCVHHCPPRAITEIPRTIGTLEAGRSNGISLARGILNVGEAMAVPVISQLKRWKENHPGGLTILDAPPGTSCPVVETLGGADYVLLVTEPTPFGLHDLRLAVEMVREMKIPMGVIINRDGIGDEAVEAFCEAEGLPVLLRIPFDREIAEGLARGRTLLEVRPEFRDMFRRMMERIEA